MEIMGANVNSQEMFKPGGILAKEKRLQIIEILLPCSVILSSYNLFGISLMYLILAVYSVFRILLHKDTLYINKQLTIFLFFIFINQLLLIGWNQDSVNVILKNLFEVFLTTGIIVILSNAMRKEYLYKPYAIVGCIAMVGIFIQSFQVHILGNSVVPIQIFPTLLGDTHQWYYYTDRPMSFFVEPQAYATFILPLLFICLERKNLKFAGLITFSVMLSTSSLGIIMSSLIWIMYVINSRFSIKKTIMAIFVIVLFTAMFTQLSLFEHAFSKILATDIDNNARLSQGFEIWLQMPLEDKITGIGKGTLTDYIDEKGIWLKRMPLASNPSKWSYVTTISGTLIYYGIIGAAIFYLMLIKMVRNKKSGFSTFALAIVALSFGQTILFNAWYILWYTMYFCCVNKKNNRDYFVIGYK